MKDTVEPHYTIREATLDDVEPIRRMHAASWLATYPNEAHGVSFEWVKNRTDDWLTPASLEVSKGYVAKAIHDTNGFYRVAEIGGEIVGFVHATTNDDGTKEFEAIYVHPDMFGRGLGEALMTQVLKWIGDAEARLEVATYNARAIRFYEKHGFRIVKGTESLYADTIPIIQMKRKQRSHTKKEAK